MTQIRLIYTDKFIIFIINNQCSIIKQKSPIQNGRDLNIIRTKKLNPNSLYRSDLRYRTLDSFFNARLHGHLTHAAGTAGAF